jgi:4-alpha-glucanotransferase
MPSWDYHSHMANKRTHKTPRSTAPTSKTILAERSSGVLVHPSSLPGGHGIGDLGVSAHEFVDFLQSAKQRVWQVLPMGPTCEEEFHSPYATVSAFAGNPLLLSLDSLVKDGLLTRQAVTRHLRANPVRNDPRKVDFKNLPRLKIPLVVEAARNFIGKKAETAIADFTAEHPWVTEYAEYAALRAHFKSPRQTWPTTVRLKPKDHKKALGQYITDADVRDQVVIQLLFFRQWERLRTYARTKGVRLFGDLPIYVSNDSADVWGNPTFFEVDRETGKPTLLSGVPPDMFNSNGQLWGHPIYNWKNLAKDGFSWWIDRFKVAQGCFDIVRVDHFRGFESYWAVPSNSDTAKNGRWKPCPGEAMFATVQRALGDLPLFVEDLGIITQPVHALRDRFELMGTRVLQFAFGGDVNNTSKSRHHPINTPHNTVVYTATHDNAPVGDWFADLPKANKQKMLGLLNDCSPKEVPQQFTRLAMSLPANLCILLMQDALGVGKGHRMNYPGVAAWKNWSWRFQDIPRGTAERLAHLSEIYERNK